MTGCAFAIGSLLGLVVFQIPAPILSMSMAVVLGFWSTLRSSPARDTKNALAK
jgi:hypothetical protein